MDKNELILQIYNDYDIDDMIIKNIHQSKQSDSHKDLYQEIYFILYQLSYSRLYYLYTRNQINFFIIGIIKNERNNQWSNYNKNLRYNNNEYDENNYNCINFIYNKMCWDNYDNTLDSYLNDKQNDETEREKKLDFINDYLNKFKVDDLDTLDEQEKNKYAVIEIYKLYIKKKKKGYSFTSLSKELNMNRQTFSNIIQQAKEIILNEYKKINK